MTLEGRLNAFCQTMGLGFSQSLNQVCHFEVTFKELMARYQSLPGVDGIFRNRLTRGEHCGFQIRDQQFTQTQEVVHWTTTFRRPSLNAGQPMPTTQCFGQPTEQPFLLARRRYSDD